jgi:hypothetical protein
MEGILSRRKDALNSLVKDCYDFCTNISTCLESNILDLGSNISKNIDTKLQETNYESRHVAEGYFVRNKPSKKKSTKAVFSNTYQSHPRLDPIKKPEKKEVKV